MKNIFIIIPLCVFFSACGYFHSGTWENDPKNWERAYQQKAPDYVKVVNSWYWQSAHWSYECQLFFEVDSCKAIKDAFLEGNNSEMLKLVTDTLEVSSRLKKITDDQKPLWFAPKPLSEYDIWNSDDIFDNFILLIDKETDQLFWYDIQL